MAKEKPMTNNTQLPAEIENKIFNVLLCHTYASRAVASKELAQLFATELHHSEQEIAQLKRWKMEAAELLNPILEYGQSKEASISLGESITNAVLERCKQAVALQAKCERHEEALREAKETINWMWQHMKEPDGQTLLRVDEFNRPANALHIIDEALSGEGEKARSNIATICHALAEEVAKDADTAEAYLKKEGVDVAKIKEDAKFIAWLAELAILLHRAAQGQPIKINQEEARKWYDDGMTAYQCFRETWNME